MTAAARPDYRERQIMQRQQAAAHRKDPPPGCICVDCLGVEGFHRMLLAKAKAEAERIGEAPF